MKKKESSKIYLGLFNLDDIALTFGNILLDVLDIGPETFQLIVQLANVGLFFVAHQRPVADSQRLRQRSAQLIPVAHQSTKIQFNFIQIS